jgi:O-antigen/teichoic acid export membrane protein
VKQALRLSVLAFGLTLIASAGFGAYNVFVLGHVDEKFGDAWGNFQFALQIVAVTAGVEAFALFLLALLPAVRRFTLRGLPEFSGAFVLAALTLTVYPPRIPHMFLAAAAIAAMSLVAAIAVAALRRRRA